MRLRPVVPSHMHGTLPEPQCNMCKTPPHGILSPLRDAVGNGLHHISHSRPHLASFPAIMLQRPDGPEYMVRLTTLTKPPDGGREVTY